ncbi:MAG: M28 family peptidase [Candidatus Bipolaricaulaceae bacterium]
MRKAKGTSVSLSWKPRRFIQTFRNLVAEIPGSRIPQEVVVLGAHLASFPRTVGAADNAAGCAVILKILRWFCKNTLNAPLPSFGSLAKSLIGAEAGGSWRNSLHPKRLPFHQYRWWVRGGHRPSVGSGLPWGTENMGGRMVARSGFGRGWKKRRR